MTFIDNKVKYLLEVNEGIKKSKAEAQDLILSAEARIKLAQQNKALKELEIENENLITILEEQILFLHERIKELAKAKSNLEEYKV